MQALGRVMAVLVAAASATSVGADSVADHCRLRIISPVVGTGSVIVELDVEDDVRSVELQLDGRVLARIDGAPWRVAVDLSGGPQVVGVAARGGRCDGLEDAVVANSGIGDRADVRLVELVVPLPEGVEPDQLAPERVVVQAGDSSFRPISVERTVPEQLAVATVLDLSTSVDWSEGRLGARVWSLLDDLLRPEDLLSVVVFRDRADELVPLSTDRQHAAGLLPRLRSGGRTSALWDGMTLGLERVRHARAPALVVVSDGQAANSIATEWQVLELLRTSHCPVHAVVVGYTPASKWRRRERWRALSELVRRSGGAMYWPELDGWPHVQAAMKESLTARARVTVSLAPEVVGPFRVRWL